jgi:hypothetical protein
MPLEHDQLRSLATGLQSVQQGSMNAHAFSALARQQTALLDALPERYQEVLLQLLDRLESSALFSEESCSFSPKGLLENLQAWVDKAGAQL